MTRELLVRGLHALRRSTIWWGIGIVAFSLMNASVWPTLEGTDALTSLEGMSEGFLEAFGAQNIATPSGYLDGQLYALMLPLLLSGMAIAGATAITSGDEDAGRLELLHALPISRRALCLSRFASATAAVSLVSLLAAVVVGATLPAFKLSEAGVGSVVVATLACGLLAVFHGAVGYAIGGFGGSRGMAAGGGVLVLVLGYVVGTLLPLARGLDPARRFSPWYWAIGQQPVSDGVSPARLVLLVAVTAALVAGGTLAVERRDIRTA